MKCQSVRVIIGYEVSQYSTVAVCCGGESRWEIEGIIKVMRVWIYEGDGML